MDFLGLNAAKLWKWAYLLVERAGGAVRVVPSVESPREMTFELRSRDRGTRLGVLICNEEGLALEVGNQRRPLAGAADRELRTQEVVPFLEDQLGLSAAQGADDSAPAASLRALGLYATARASKVRSSEDGSIVACGSLVFDLKRGSAWNAHLTCRDLSATKGWPSKRVVEELLEFEHARTLPGQVEPTITCAFEPLPGPACFDPDDAGRLIVAGGGGLEIWTHDGGAREPLGMADGTPVVWGPKGNRWLISAGGEAMRWPPGPGERVRFDPIQRPNAGGRRGNEIFADDRHLAAVDYMTVVVATCDAPRDPRAWSTMESWFLPVAKGVYAVGPCAVPASGEIAVTTASAKLMLFAEGRAKEIDGSTSGGHPEYCAAHPTEPLAVCCSRSVQFFDVEARRFDGEFRLEAFGLMSKPYPAFTPDGRYLLLLQEGRLLMVRLSTRTLKSVLLLPWAAEQADHHSLAISRDGSHVAISWGGTWAVPFEALERRYAAAPALEGAWFPSSDLY